VPVRKVAPLAFAVLFALVNPAQAGHLEPFRGGLAVPGNPGTPEKVELGKMLFFDRRLSGDGTMSCATCHIPDLGFGDGQQIGLNYPTTRNWRNTQTLLNVALLTRNAPLDRFLDGDGNALSEEAKRGLAVFTGKGRCTDCHYGVALIDNSFHALEVPDPPEFDDDPRVIATRRFVAKVNHFEEFRTLKDDPGRYLVTKDKKDWRAFRTPTLRDVARTGPYMHNGVYETLEEVVDFFDAGAAEGLEPLNLTAGEKTDLVVFMQEALTGEDLGIRPPRVP
jgi:cytochrome c peroxidase